MALLKISTRDPVDGISPLFKASRICCRKDTNSFPFRVLPCTILGFTMDATSCFNCSRLCTYKGSSSLSSISHNFVLCRCGWGKLKAVLLSPITAKESLILLTSSIYLSPLSLGTRWRASFTIC
uniref:Uncharacterized protein n=1 Tax=Arundo donax TaxID=35708 RepID=A0A0A9E2E0_ARUDO